MVIKYDKNSNFNFDRKVCNGLKSTKNSDLLVWQYLHNYQYFVEQLPSNA